MNDKIEHRPGTRRGATQTGCRQWTPIVPVLPEKQDTDREKQGKPHLDEDPMPAADQKQTARTHPGQPNADAPHPSRRR